MRIKERRRNKRCNQDTGIVYSLLNKTEQRAAAARNYSKFGMFFETDRPLPTGTTIVIRTLGCDITGSRIGNGFESGPAPFYCRDAQPPSDSCKQLKNLVVAEVKRCENCKDLNREYYGIGVHYMSPAV